MTPFAILFVIFVGFVFMENLASLFVAQRTMLMTSLMVSGIAMTLSAFYMKKSHDLKGNGHMEIY